MVATADAFSPVNNVGSGRVLVLDAPVHAVPWPFQFDFSLIDKTKWLGGIIVK
jgi:hypothetical protein